MHKNFNYNFKIYYEDTDAGGVVYYANYLKFLERARTEALFDLGLSNSILKKDFGSLIIVKSCNIEYKKSAYLEDNLSISSYISSSSKTSLIMNQSIFRSNEKIVVADIHLVFVNENVKPIKISESIMEKFKPYFKLN